MSSIYAILIKMMSSIYAVLIKMMSSLYDVIWNNSQCLHGATFTALNEDAAANIGFHFSLILILIKYFIMVKLKV